MNNPRDQTDVNATPKVFRHANASDPTEPAPRIINDAGAFRYALPRFGVELAHKVLTGRILASPEAMIVAAEFVVANSNSAPGDLLEQAQSVLASATAA